MAISITSPPSKYKIARGTGTYDPSAGVGAIVVGGLTFEPDFVLVAFRTTSMYNDYYDAGIRVLSKSTDFTYRGYQLSQQVQQAYGWGRQTVNQFNGGSFDTDNMIVDDGFKASFSASASSGAYSFWAIKWS